MGAFFLSNANSDSKKQKLAITELFEKQGFSHIVDLSNKKHVLFYCRKINVSEDSYYVLDKQNFCVITGTLIYKKSIGVAAAKRVFDDVSAGQINTDELYGNFAIVICLKGEIRIVTDTQGVYNVWHDKALSVASSSFLAVANLVEKPTINVDSVYEYVFQEATFGGDTVLNEVQRLRVKQGLLFGKDNELIAGLSLPNGAGQFVDIDTSIEQSKQALFKQFEAIASCFSNNVDSALSGGYDSRLLLALCLQHGIEPHLHVYGSQHDADVIVAKGVCAGEGLELSHEDKSGFETVTPEQFETIVEQNFYAFQGVCPDGILDNGSDLLTRQQRTKSGRLLLNGGGGEVFRNFFYLPDKKYRALNILWSFYSRFDPDVCTKQFDEKRYYQVFEEKINALLEASNGQLTRQQVEHLYAGFRCTYWMGLNNAINNQYGYFLTPFVEELVSNTAQAVPVKYKNHGYYEARLINKISPTLASYMSDYGHDFSGTIPFKRKLKDWATLIRPTWLRKYTYRMKKHSKQGWPYYLGDDYMAKVLPNGWCFMPEFFDMNKVNDLGQFKRIATLEYLFQKLNVGLGK